MGDLILAADSHLHEEGEEADLFLRFLRRRGRTARKVILVGDIFDLWIARPRLELSFHRAFLEAVSELGRSGVEVKYVQGNRDYYVADRYGSDPFAAVAEDALLERHGGRRIHVSHGDLVNRRDRQYRAWRRFSRAAPLRLAFSLIPAGPAGRLSNYLERRFRTTNQKYRLAFPEDEARRYAAEVFGSGADAIVLGHFHERRLLELPVGEGTRPLYVLPGWREERGYLRFGPDGRAAFEVFDE